MGSGGCHLLEGPGGISGLQINGSHRVGNRKYLKAFLQGVQYRSLYAVVGGKSGNIDRIDAFSLQDLVQALAVLVYRWKPFKSVPVWRIPLADYQVNARPVEGGMQIGSRATLDAMRRPDSALFFERYMIRRVPVSGGRDEIERRGKPIDHFDDLVAVRDGQSAARAEIILNIDQNKRG